MEGVRVGTSGWQYDDWRPAFYPDGVGKARWFEHYAQAFPTVEINASFYRLPTERSISRWHDQAPDRFRYAAKASNYVTHNLKIGGEDLPAAIGNVMGRLQGLKTFLAAVLWQLPGTLHRDVDRLDRFLGLLPGGVRHAVEFRHPSWQHPDVFARLRAHRAAHVWVSSEAMPPDRTVTSDLVYLRFHGFGDHPASYRYSPEELRPWADAVMGAGGDALVYFNNDVGAAALEDARCFTELLGDAAVPWP